MADQTGSRYQTMDSSDRPVGGWTEELIVFAGVMMIMSGIFQCFAGVVAIFDNAVYVTTLGWIQLLLGVVVALAGAALGSGPHLGSPGRRHPGRLQRPGLLPAHPLLPVLGPDRHHVPFVRDVGPPGRNPVGRDPGRSR